MTELLRKLSDDLKSLNCLCGFDGFVDEIVHTVDKRIDSERYSRVETLSEYGKRIAAASGLSLNVEIVPVSRKLGGNGPIFALGLQKYGCEITYIGCVGNPEIHSVFEELASSARMIGIAEPGQTDAMEFTDGKIIRSKLTTLNQVTWENVMSKLNLHEFVQLLDQANMISFNNWTMLPHMSEIWKHILNKAVPAMCSRRSEKVFFFDLADPAKRKPEDILEALELIKNFHAKGFKTVLGLNKKEACEIASLIGCQIISFVEQPLHELVHIVGDFMAIDCVVVHPVDRAACLADGEYVEVEGPYCAAPKLTTGAGDNFNSGFMLGYLNGWPLRESLICGVASSGYYVRNAHSADIKDLAGFLAD